MNQSDYEELDQLSAVEIGAEYRSYRVPSDGRCQFSSLLAALHEAVLYGAVDVRAVVGLTARSLRERVVDWLKAHGDTQLEVERPGTLRTRHYGMMNTSCWDAYLVKMRADAPDEYGYVEWDDETTLMAISCLCNLTVQVVRLDSVQILNTIQLPTQWQTASSSIIHLCYKPELH